VTTNTKIRQELNEFFARYVVKSVVCTSRNMGCPREKGPDFLVGENCPFCPYWKGKQGSKRRK
jgi:hypothetical protein